MTNIIDVILRLIIHSTRRKARIFVSGCEFFLIRWVGRYKTRLFDLSIWGSSFSDLKGSRPTPLPPWPRPCTQTDLYFHFSDLFYLLFHSCTARCNNGNTVPNNPNGATTRMLLWWEGFSSRAIAKFLQICTPQNHRTGFSICSKQILCLMSYYKRTEPWTVCDE